MAISVQDQVKAKRRAFNALRVIGLGASASQALSTLLQELSQKLGNIQLQVQEFDLQTSAASDSVIADAACKVYGIFTRKTNATAAWLKGSDSASASSSTAAEWMAKLAVATSDTAALFPQGFPMANGFTLGSDTTASGTTNSTAGDGPKGFVIIGAP